MRSTALRSLRQHLENNLMESGRLGPAPSSEVLTCMAVIICLKQWILRQGAGDIVP